MGPITDEEAAQYVRALGLEGKLVEQCVGLVGGSLPLLERCAGLRRNGLDFAGARGGIGLLWAATQCMASALGKSKRGWRESASSSPAAASLPGIKERLLSLMDDTYQAAGMLDESPQREGGLAVANALLASKERCIPASTWRDKLPDREHQEELTRAGVFRFDGKEVGARLGCWWWWCSACRLRASGDW